MFLIVLLVLYFCVVLPLEKVRRQAEQAHAAARLSSCLVCAAWCVPPIALLPAAALLYLLQLQYAAFKHKAIMRDCPYCLEEISMAATRCKHCCGELEIDEEMQTAIDLATAALNEADKKQGCVSRLLGRCMKPRGTLVRGNSSGAVQLEEVAVDTTPLHSPKSAATMMASRTMSRSRTGSGRSHSGIASPTSSYNSMSFHSPLAGTPEGASTPMAGYAGCTATATTAAQALGKQQHGLRQ